MMSNLAPPLVLTLALVFHLNAVCGKVALAQSDTQASVKDTSTPADAKAAACAHTLEQFVSALDSVLTENPQSIFRYHAVLARYLFLKNGVRNLPAPAPDAVIDGCRIDEAVQIAKRSKFFYGADGPPRYQYYRIEFRNSVAKVAFSVEKTTGTIVYPNATWIAASL
jgi:hypothetical protein